MTTAITLTPTKLKIRIPYAAPQDLYADTDDMHLDLKDQLKDDTDDRYTIKTKITKKHYIYTFTTVKKEHGKTTVDMQDTFYLVEFFQRKQIADAGDVLKTVYKGNKLVVTLKSNIVDPPSYIEVEYKGDRPMELIFRYGCEYVLDGTGIDLETGRKDAFYNKKDRKDRKEIESNIAQEMRDYIYYLLHKDFRCKKKVAQEFISNHDKQIREAASKMYTTFKDDGKLDDLENPEGDWLWDLSRDILTYDALPLYTSIILKDIDYDNKRILRMKPKN